MKHYHWIRSIKFKLFLLLVMPVILLFMLSIWNAETTATNFTINNVETAVKSLSRSLSFGLSSALPAMETQEDTEFLLEAMVSNEGQNNINYIAILDEDDELYAQAGNTPSIFPETRDIVIDKQDILHFDSPILLPDATVGTLRYGLAIDTIKSNADEILNKQRLKGLTGLVIIIMVLGSSIAFVLFGLHKRLNQLISTSRSIADGKYEVRLDNLGQDEISVLSQQMNRMAEAIESRVYELEENDHQIQTLNKNLFSAMDELQASQKNIHDSISYASLIQTAILPEHHILHKYFDDAFTLWMPKDVVGGDIYLAEEISQDEIIIMVIDCTGHGVPGAFVTMLVKAIQTQMLSSQAHEKIISPAEMLKTFDNEIKNMLKQQDTVEKSAHAGFDGGIIYFNKATRELKYAGANLPLFLIHNHEIKIQKGDRHSVGYQKIEDTYQFTEHVFNLPDTAYVYLSSDGYFDQNGGAKGFPMGKRMFKELIAEHHSMPMANQRNLFIEQLNNYQANEERNDDICVIGFKI